MAMRAWTQRIVEGIVKLDRSAVDWGFALRCSAGVALPLIVATASGHVSAAFALAVGALITGCSSTQGIHRSRIATMLVVAAGIAVASFIGALVSPSTVLLIAITAIVGYLYGTVSQLGMPASVAALNVTVAFIIFSSIPLAPAADLVQSGLLMAGGFIQILLLLIAWPIDRFAIERRGLAAAYNELADFARSIGTPNAAVPPIGALSQARQIAADRQPFARTRDVARFARILDQAEALRSRLSALKAMQSNTPEAAMPAFSEFARAVAVQLSALGSMLEGSQKYIDLDAVRDATFAAYDAFEQAYTGNDFARALGRDIVAHLRDATQGVAVVATGHPARLMFSGAARPSAYIETRIDWLSRDAFRNAAVLAIAMLIGHTVFSADRGYWIALTAALVLRPDLQGTIVRGFARLLGTLAGAVLAAIALLVVHGNPALKVTGLILAAATCYVTLVPNYALFSTGITVFVILALNLGFERSGTIVQRVVDTFAGGTLAMIGYTLLPTWSRRRTRPLLVEFIEAQRAFAMALLDAYAQPNRGAAASLAALRTHAWKIRTDVESAIDLARAEPHRPHTIGTDRALQILAATQSFALASMALESGLETMSPAPPLPALVPFRNALDRNMHELAAALSEERRANIDDSLPRTYEELEKYAEQSQHPAYRFIASYADGYVQAVATLADLTGPPANRRLDDKR